MNKKLLEKSVANANFERIKNKAILEEKGWYQYMPPSPTFIIPQVKKSWIAGIKNLVRQMKP